MVDIFEPQNNDPIDADLIAELVRRSRRTVSGPGIIETLDGWFVRPLAQEGGGGVNQTVLVARDGGEFPDHLECRAVGSDPETYTPILVAKPWFLRKTPWHSVSPEDLEGPVRELVRYVYDDADSTKRTAYDATQPPGTSEASRLKRNEQVHGRYLLGDIVNITPAVTGVTVAGVNDEGLPIVISIVLLDLNVDGREWKTYYEWL